MNTTTREPRPGELCECGRSAVTVYATDRFGDVPSCGVNDTGAHTDSATSNRPAEIVVIWARTEAEALTEADGFADDFYMRLELDGPVDIPSRDGFLPFGFVLASSAMTH